MNRSHRTTPSRLCAFTLVELLTVVAILAILMSLLFSVLGSVKESARRMQAKHDLLQVVAAINAYNAEYGVYPIKAQPAGQSTEVTFATSNSDLVATLGSLSTGANEQYLLNPRRIVFMEFPLARNPANPRSGVANGNWYDPWGPQTGKPESGIYHIRIDGSYSNFVSDPYPGDHDDNDKWHSAGDPPATIHLGVIAWSLARTGIQTYELQDQVLSWK